MSQKIPSDTTAVMYRPPHPRRIAALFGLATIIIKSPMMQS